MTTTLRFSAWTAAHAISCAAASRRPRERSARVPRGEGARRAPRGLCARPAEHAYAAARGLHARRAPGASHSVAFHPPRPRLAAEVTEPTRGIKLQILTTAPGMQVGLERLQAVVGRRCTAGFQVQGSWLGIPS